MDTVGDGGGSLPRGRTGRMSRRLGEHATTALHDDWRARYSGGESVTDIAKSAGVSRQWVYCVLHRKGSLVEDRKKARLDRREVIVDLALLGVPARQICLDTGYSRSHVDRVLAEHRKRARLEGGEPHGGLGGAGEGER